MSRINIINASAKDFAIESFNTLPAGTNHEDGRIIKRMDGTEVKFYMWDASSSQWVEFANSSELDALSQALSSEVSTQSSNEVALASADTSLEERISTEEAARSTAVENEVAARSAAVSTEASVRAAQDVVLSTAIATEVSDRESDVDTCLLYTSPSPRDG